MFETAGIRSTERVCSALSIVSLAVLLGACAHTSPPDPAVPKSWVVENVASKTTEELYREFIKPGVFERSSSKVIDGYTVESGNLVMPDKSVGSLITVRSKDGSLTAFIEGPDKRGLLVVTSNGESRFSPSSPHDYSLPDTLQGKEVLKPPASVLTGVASPYVIDILIGYSRAAVVLAGGDAYANALAKVESVNLALRNSLTSNVSMRLAGVQIVEQNYPMNGETLEKLPQIFSSGMQNYNPDMLFGAFAPTPDDTAAGLAYLPGRTAIGHVSDGWVFRHEVAHNAGGNHCHVPGGSYNYGFKNGKNGTILCGEDTPYYSNPNVRDENGLPRGNSTTADMARVWRENAQRLSSYATCLTKPPTEFRVTSTSYGTIDFAWARFPGAAKYEIWGRDNLLLPPKKYGESTTLNGKAINVPNGIRPYHLKAVCSDGTISPNSNVVSAKPYEVLK
ncbi:hypothetical protein [Pseudomonas moorei]|uniref:hypothetical protein n=1 Tax=Pseudomonas moorei TaxID=395599 RepID=UPI0020107ABB|nr:hypothetical protein [Pseudomonas moorei]